MQTVTKQHGMRKVIQKVAMQYSKQSKGGGTDKHNRTKNKNKEETHQKQKHVKCHNAIRHALGTIEKQVNKNDWKTTTTNKKQSKTQQQNTTTTEQQQPLRKRSQCNSACARVMHTVTMQYGMRWGQVPKKAKTRTQNKSNTTTLM